MPATTLINRVAHKVVPMSMKTETRKAPFFKQKEGAKDGLLRNGPSNQAYPTEPNLSLLMQHRDSQDVETSGSSVPLAIKPCNHRRVQPKPSLKKYAIGLDEALNHILDGLVRERVYDKNQNRIASNISNSQEGSDSQFLSLGNIPSVQNASTISPANTPDTFSFQKVTHKISSSGYCSHECSDEMSDNRAIAEKLKTPLF